MTCEVPDDCQAEISSNQNTLFLSVVDLIANAIKVTEKGRSSKISININRYLNYV